MTTEILTHIPDDVRHEATADAALILDLRPAPDADRLVEFDDDGYEGRQ